MVAAEEPSTVWTVVRQVSCKSFGRIVVFDSAPDVQYPGAYAALRPAGAEHSALRSQGFSLVSAPGEPAAINIGLRRRPPPAFEEAFRVGGQVAVTELPGNNDILRGSGARANLVYNCGRLPLAMAPMVAVLRWRPPEGVAPPRVWWCVHTEEEADGVAEALKSAGPPLDPAPAAGLRVTVLRCGVVADGPAVGEAVAGLHELLGPGAVAEENCGAEGIKRLPRLLQAAVAADAAEGIGCALETFGSTVLHSQLCQLLPGARCGPQRSFGCRPELSKDRAGLGPWPLDCIMPWKALLPWRSASRPLAFQDWLFLPTDPLPIALFRIAFGYLCAYYAFNAIHSGRVQRDHVYADMRFKYDHLEFLGPDAPPEYVHYIYYAMGWASVGILIGWPYRISCLVYTITFTWHFFAEATYYNNHYWLMTLLGLHLLLANAASCLVLNPPRVLLGLLRGAWRRLRPAAVPSKRDAPAGEPQRDADGTPVVAAADRGGELRHRGPAAASDAAAKPAEPKQQQQQQAGDAGAVSSVRPIPQLYHFMFRNFVIFVFFMGSIAKLNSDWISAHTMRAGMDGNPPWVIGELACFFLSWGGLIFDGVGPLYLLHSMTRPLGMLLHGFFNGSNAVMFSIGVFPYMMLGAMPLLCESWTPRAALRKLGARLQRYAQQGTAPARPGRCHGLRRRCAAPARKAAGFCGGQILDILPPYGDGMQQFHDAMNWRSRPDGALPPPLPEPLPSWSPRSRLLVTLLVLLAIAVHVAVPLRHYVYHSGSDQWVAWTERGRKFSWHMMSRHKNCSGTVTVTHPATNLTIPYTISAFPPFQNTPLTLNDHQIKKLPTIATYVRQFCWKLRKSWESGLAIVGEGSKVETADDIRVIRDKRRAIRVRADVSCSLNGGKWQPFISPKFDLSREPAPAEWVPEPWVLPQKQFTPEADIADLGRGWLP